MAQTNPPVSLATTVVIPVWNGAAVIQECLAALYANSGPRLHAVVAVDNGSADDSAACIEGAFPQVQLLRSTFNLGFAGGVNLGIAAALADPAPELVVLLNQDCLVDPGWLDALGDALAGDPQAVIGGCTIYNADHTVNHAGARIELPLAYARHLTTPAPAPARVEYVTGAVFAIRRAAWAALGPLDEDFYPAYYEEADYCYRAARHGWGVLYAPAASAHHLQSSRAWRNDPLLHCCQQHRARYRFVAKHLAGAQLADFLAAEQAAVAREEWFDQALGRAVAARRTLAALDATLARRSQELGDCLPAADRRRLQVALAALAQAALQRSYQLAERSHAESLARRLRRRLGLLGANSAHQPPAAARGAAQIHVLSLLAEYEHR
jgi:GT2 family glycosyltransferase